MYTSLLFSSKGHHSHSLSLSLSLGILSIFFCLRVEFKRNVTKRFSRTHPHSITHSSVLTHRSVPPLSHPGLPPPPTVQSCSRTPRVRCRPTGHRRPAQSRTPRPGGTDSSADVPPRVRPGAAAAGDSPDAGGDVAAAGEIAGAGLTCGSSRPCSVPRPAARTTCWDGI